MSQHRPVPGIAQGPREFSPSNYVPMQSPIGHPPQQPPVVSESMQDLAMEIYARLAVDHIAAMGQKLDPLQLAELAKASQTAALAYFQTMGVPNG